MRGALLAGLALAMCGGCVEKIAESQVRSALLQAGLPADTADCMAGRMARRLSIGQLRKLEQLQGDKRTLADYVAAVRRVGDPEAVAVTASSAALCSMGLAR
jgi:cAMP phosphodiesterase